MFVDESIENYCEAPLIRKFLMTIEKLTNWSKMKKFQRK